MLRTRVSTNIRTLRIADDEFILALLGSSKWHLGAPIKRHKNDKHADVLDEKLDVASIKDKTMFLQYRDKISIIERRKYKNFKL